MSDETITLSSSDEEDTPVVKKNYNLTIEGINVVMPVKPYPCQESVITSIINGCKTEQHCLLESPTGSGKTLALLCGALAWQINYENNVALNIQKQKNKEEADKIKDATEKDDKIKGVDVPPLKECCKKADTCEATCADEDINDMSFEPGDWSDDDFTDFNSGQSLKVPKIYYGSRTHRQIKQVVREFGKTYYKDRRMTILSSREFSCIQHSDGDKTKLCAELLDPTKKRGCPYYSEENKTTLGTNNALTAHGIGRPWDIEELVELGRGLRACPYFAARNLMLEADIIFCPYNYLIDPAIRDSMQIDLRGSIVILDEAHNIEDICRNCGSVSLPLHDIDVIIKECQQFLDNKPEDADYASVILYYCTDIDKFIKNTPLKPQKGNSDNYCSDYWTGTEFVTLLDVSKVVTPQKTETFMRAVQTATSILGKAKEASRMGVVEHTLPSDIVRMLEKFLFAIKMVISGNASDYRVVVNQIPHGFGTERALQFLCMNPAVIFSPLCTMARTVILASGTLSPMNSYQHELGVKFPFMLQADHVTPQEQVLIKCVSKGPAGKNLRATYSNVTKWEFQDDLGNVLLTACESVPHGVLMFFSSYALMGTIINRWKTNGLWEKLEWIKEVFQEPRGTSNLTTVMEEYRESIKNSSEGPVGSVTGALLLAVFRGKVAEGIDFSDNEARCVITVGIPYAVRSDPHIEMKYAYNDLNRSKGLLSGHDWYTIQAFRALNQALGRAIRHQNDWGAIILIDERFLDIRNINLLPAWVRSMWIRQSGIRMDFRCQLKQFVAKQRRRDRQKLRLLANISS